MKSLRVYSRWPGRHKDFKSRCFAPSSSTQPQEYKDNCYNEADFFMRRVGGRVLDEIDKDKGSNIAFSKCANGVKEVLKSIDWSFTEAFQTSQPNISNEEIVYAYEKYKNK